MKVRFTDFKKEFLFLERELINSFKNIGRKGNYILGEDLNMSDIAFYHNNQLFIFEYDGDTGMIKYQNKILLKQINY